MATTPKKPVPQATSQTSPGVDTGTTQGKDMGTKDAAGQPVFKKLPKKAYESKAVVDEVGLTWGPTQNGCVVSHN